MTRGEWTARFAVSAIAIVYFALVSLQVKAATGYIQLNLVSDIPLLADFTDPNLVNPWGIAISTTSPFWVCDNGTGVSTIYGAGGKPAALVVSIPPPAGGDSPGACSGMVFNSTQNFDVAPGAPASFIFATEDGTISGWNSSANSTKALIVVDKSASGAVYKGLAMASTGSATLLYAANFNSGQIDVFDSNFAPVVASGHFADAAIPSGFAPFNIVNIGGKLFVSYAKQDSAKHDDVAGPGNGYVDIFDVNGNLLQHLIAGAPLNSPWGMTLASANFGTFSNDLLVGNFGDGRINAFDPSTGKLIGPVSSPSGNPISVPGLWALQFGNGASGGDANTLYFSAGIGGGASLESHGLFGSIASATGTGLPAIFPAGVVNDASFSPGTTPLAPGTLAAVFGTNLDDGSMNPSSGFDSNGNLVESLGNATITFNGIPAPIFGVVPGQMNVMVPFEMAGVTSATVQVSVGGQPSVTMTVPIGPASPGIFTLSSSGSGQGAVEIANTNPAMVAAPAGSLSGLASRPVNPGEFIMIFCTGLGAVTNQPATGAPSPGNPVATTLAPVQVSIGGITVPAIAALVPGLVAEYQVNVQIPNGVAAGNAVQVIVSVGGQQSNTATIAVAAAAPQPPPLTVSSVALSSSDVIGDDNYQGTVTLSTAANTATTVSLTGSNPLIASVPATVTIPAGSASVTFVVMTSAPATTTTVTLSASFGGVTQSANLTVEPEPVTPYPYTDY